MMRTAGSMLAVLWIAVLLVLLAAWAADVPPGTPQWRIETLRLIEERAS